MAASLDHDTWLLLKRLAESSIEKFRFHIPRGMEIDDVKAEIVSQIPHLLLTKPPDMSKEGYMSSRAAFEVRRMIARFESRRPVTKLDDLNAEDIAYNAEPDEDTRGHVDLSDQLAPFLARLTCTQRRIVLLFYSGFSHKVIARKIYTKVKNVRRWFHEAMEILGVDDDFRSVRTGTRVAIPVTASLPKRKAA